MDRIKVVQYGLGPIGNQVTRYLAERGGYEVVGGIDWDPAKVGRDVGELAGLGSPLGARITDDSQGLLSRVEADVVVLTTQSSLKQVRPQLLEIVSHGMHIVSTCEELAYPWVTAPQMAQEINLAAKERGVAVLATGVNPGFLMDLFPLVLSGVCQRVSKVTVERIQDAQFRRLPFQRKIGAGLSVEAFQHKVEEGTLRHVGLTESMHMIAARLKWELDRVEESIEPVIAQERVTTQSMTIEPGQVLGVSQSGRGCVGKDEVIRLVFRAAIGEADPRDRVIIEGNPPLDVTIAGGTHGDVATGAIVVNAIPVVMRAPAGLRTMADVEPVTCYAT